MHVAGLGRKTMKRSSPASSRHEFPVSVKRKLAMRVAYQCSYPGCRIQTVGPTEDASGTSNLGDAAHITAAAKGGPRYDSSLTEEQRRSIENGIWMCANHARQIDNDTSRYTVELLRKWKSDGEQRAREVHGQPLPSAREYAVYKTIALGENVTGGSVTELVDRSSDIAKRDIEKLDDRVTVDITRRDGITECHIQAPPGSLDWRVEPAHIEEFTEKVKQLIDHGTQLEIDTAAMRFTGSRILELFEGRPGTVTMATEMRRRAVHRLVFTPPGSRQPDVIDVTGELVGGRESATFEGKGLDGLLSMSYRFLRRADVEVKVESQICVDWQVWNGHPIHRLPHYDRFARFIRATQGGDVHGNLEVDGYQAADEAPAHRADQDQVASLHAVVTYVDRAREVATYFKVHPSFQIGELNLEDDTAFLQKIWFLLFKMSTLRGHAIPSITMTAGARDEAEAEMLRAAVESAKPLSVRAPHQPRRPLSIFGTRVVVGLITVDYSHATLQLDGPTDAIRVDSLFDLTIVPTDECVVTVRHFDATGK
jgi:hypothetical protein